MGVKDEFLLNRLKWVSFYRVIIAFFSLFLIIYWKSKLEIVTKPSYFIATLIFVFLISIVYGVVIRKIKKPFFLIGVQIFLDLLIVSFIVIATGGVESSFIFFYAFIILEGGLFFLKNGAYLAAFATIIFIGFIFIFQYYSIFPVNMLISAKSAYYINDFFYSYSIFTLEFLILSLLIGYLTSESSKIREHLEESKALFYDLEYLKSAILSSINDGLIVFSDKGINYMNQVAREISHKISQQNTENTIKNIFRKELEMLDNQRKVERFEKKINTESGDLIWLNCTLSPLIDHKDTVIGYLLSFQDLTTYKTMEENLRISDKFAFIGKLSTVIAHEIRNPLASLRGSIEYLKENVILEEDNEKVLNIVIREIERLNKFINDFLFYSRVSVTEKSKIYLNNLFKEIWFELLFSLENKNNIKFRCTGDENVLIEGDPNQIRQVFFNIFLNSIQAITAKKGVGEISVNITDSAKDVIIEIEDDAGGIDEANIEKIFDPFFTTKEGGTGLGLAIVYRIVNEHNGKIFVKNGVKGARFTLRFYK